MNSRRVLIAERDLTTRGVYRLYLERHRHEVEEAGDGLECIEKLLAWPADVLVLVCDLHWGGADGVLSRMLTDAEVPLIPVVLVADDDRGPEWPKAIMPPGTALLRKPFPMSALSRALGAAERSFMRGASD